MNLDVISNDPNHKKRYVPAVTVKVTNGHICEFYEKRIFSVSF